jgi:hypothetical protein
MFGLNIDLLSLSVENAAGHEHRIQPIAARAAALFAERLVDCWRDNRGPPKVAAVDSIAASTVSLNLAGMSDQEAASRIANAWLEALALKLKF